MYELNYVSFISMTFFMFILPGYDPSQPPENIAQQELINKSENYQKAMKACLEGRGYSVR